MCINKRALGEATRSFDAGASQAASQASMKAEDSWKVQHTFYMFWKCF
jgi:hypothetical protein